MDSKECLWEFVTADRCLTRNPCELLFAQLVPSGTTTTTSIYNGVDTNGQKIIQLNASTATNKTFRPGVPVYCERGLYIDIGSSVTGCFVIWKHYRTQP